jgi:hypothetical protein
MYPWPLDAVIRLKGADFVVAPQGQGDLIKTSKQAGAPARIDLEPMPLA